MLVSIYSSCTTFWKNILVQYFWVWKNFFHPTNPKMSYLPAKEIKWKSNIKLMLLLWLMQTALLLIMQIIGEFGSFDQYIWGFVNHKPMVGRFRYPRQVPVKTAKADVISKDLVRRGFRSVGPTVVYVFMQVAGITNDHLTSCFRFQECVDAWENRVQGKQPENINDLGLARAMGDLNLSSK